MQDMEGGIQKRASFSLFRSIFFWLSFDPFMILGMLWVSVAMNRRGFTDDRMTVIKDLSLVFGSLGVVLLLVSVIHTLLRRRRLTVR
jgi:hypothetical protein